MHFGKKKKKPWNGSTGCNNPHGIQVNSQSKWNKMGFYFLLMHFVLLQLQKTPTDQNIPHPQTPNIKWSFWIVSYSDIVIPNHLFLF